MFPASKIEPAFSDHNTAILFATSSYYAEIVSVAIQSLADHMNTSCETSNYDILVIADGLTDLQLQRIASIANGKPKLSIRFLNAIPFREKSQSYHFHFLSVVTFYRLCLPSMLPEYDKILYLDCDILIRADVSEIYNTDLGNSLLAGVQDRALQFLINDWIQEPAKTLTKNGLNRDLYFNSGVMLMNLAQMRTEHTDMLFKALSTRTDLIWLDQDILNIAARNRWQALPDRWNHTLHMYMPFEISSDGIIWANLLNKDAAIVHYACTSRKPWDFWTSHFEQEWWETAMRSPSREHFLHYLPAKEEALLLEEIEHELTVLPNPTRQWQEYYQASIKKSKINYLRRMRREHNQKLTESINLPEKMIQVISPIPVDESTDGSNLPLLSVITPTFNLVKAGRIDHFKQAQQSVCNQTYPNIEHLVIDGGSTDGTLALLQDMQKRGEIRFISEPDKGIYDAMNKGTMLALGKYVTYLNTDDYWHNEEGLSISIQILESSNADFSYSPFTYLHPDGCEIKCHPTLGAFMTRMPCCHQGMVIRKEYLIKMGLYDSELKIAADYGYLLKSIKQHRPFVFVPLDYTMFRIGGISCTDVNVSIQESAKLISQIFHGNNEWVPFFESFCRDQICARTVFNNIRSQVSSDLQKMMDDVVEPLRTDTHTLSIRPNQCERVDQHEEIEQPTKQTPQISLPHRDQWIKLFSCLPLVKIKKRPSNQNCEKAVYKLFGIIPLLKIRHIQNHINYSLFQVLPIVKIKKIGSLKKRYYIFGIPFFKFV